MKKITLLEHLGGTLLVLFFFLVAPLCSVYAQDQDGDGIAQLDDLDDDNDGILDVVEGLGYNIYTSNCVGEGSVYVFNSYTLESGTALSAGAVYRFHDVAPGFDAFVTIVYTDNVTITDIDDNSIGVADAFQPRLTFGPVKGTPGAEFQIEIVQADMSTPLFIESIGGIMLDCDGNDNIRESYIIKNVSGYAVSDPTNVLTTGLGGGLVQFDSDGSGDAPSIANDPNLKIFYQNRYVYAMSITFQAVKSNKNSYGRLMSFYANECAFQTLTDPDVTITDLINFDGDAQPDYLDRDADNDGIPDLVEAGGVDTNGDGVVDNSSDADGNGYYDVYDVFNGGNTITDADTDSDGHRNRVDLDADSDGITDVMEASFVDRDADGQIDNYVDSDYDGYSDGVDGDVGNDHIAENSAMSLVLTSSDLNGDGIPESYLKGNFDNNGPPNFLDLDSDDDGVVDNTEAQGTGVHIGLTTIDLDRDGIEDSYDGFVGHGGPGLVPQNSEGHGNPDYIDINSDFDSELDAIEAHDTNGDGVIDGSDAPSANTGLFIGVDVDNDGIDDGYDNNTASFDPSNTGLAPMSHPNFDGVTIERDWREITPKAATIDFDGIDDYLETDAFISPTWGASTMMTWVKLDNTFANTGFIVGETMFQIKVLNTRVIQFGANLNNTSFYSVQSAALNTNQWYHITGVFASADNELRLYINGELVGTLAIPASSVLSNATATEGLCVGKYPDGGEYFKGAIDEIRVFDSELSQEQILQLVCQELDVTGANLKGTVLDKEIIDNATSSLIAKARLQAYYPMTDMLLNKSTDKSQYGRDIRLHNIETIQDQTAPMPYVTKTGGDGDWSNTNNWLHGDVWDITGAHSSAAIVDMTVDLHTNITHNLVGLKIAAGTELDVRDNAGIITSWHLELHGKLDLNGESQLVQTTYSDLEVTSAGSIEIDQQGKGDIFSYNHWSAPVNPVNTTANNTDYTVAGVLKDGTNPMAPQNINFIGGYGIDGGSTPIRIAEYWIFKFANLPDDYNSWFSGHVQSTGSISAGEGYSMKGSGTLSSSQNYIFEGKPNNGRKAGVGAATGNDAIQLPLSANNLYLVGNPFPSALDAHKFIDDNINTIEDNGDVTGSGTLTGALYFWDHWGGGSHALASYQGGYATLNKAGATYAIPDPDVSGVDTANGNKALPQRYIAVGQGFFVQGDSDGGTIEFNNSQRAFQREMDGNSTFISTQISDNHVPEPLTKREQTEENDMNRAYFRFTTPEGPQRQLLLAVKPGLTAGIDYGYDAVLLENHQTTDCAWMVNDTRLVIQSIGQLHNKLMLPLQIKVGAAGMCKFEAESLAEFSDFEVYLFDRYENKYSLLGEQVVSFYLEADWYDDRFYVVFEDKVQEEEDLLEITQEIADDLLVYFDTISGTIVFQNEKIFTAKNITIHNTLGQLVYNNTAGYEDVQKINLTTLLSAGAYIVSFEYNDGGNKVVKKIVAR